MCAAENCNCFVLNHFKWRRFVDSCNFKLLFSQRRICIPRCHAFPYACECSLVTVTIWINEPNNKMFDNNITSFLYLGKWNWTENTDQRQKIYIIGVDLNSNKTLILWLNKSEYNKCTTNNKIIWRK